MDTGGSDFFLGDEGAFLGDDFNDLLSADLPADGFNYLLGPDDSSGFDLGAESWDLDMQTFDFNRPFDSDMNIAKSKGTKADDFPFVRDEDGKTPSMTKGSKGIAAKSLGKLGSSLKITSESYPTPAIDDGSLTEEKRKRRLERNRESARQSRRRKKQYLELLEEKVEQLTTSLNDLRRDHLAGAAKQFRNQRNEALKNINMMRSLQDIHSDDPSLIKRVREIVNQFGPGVDHRKEVLEYYFRMLNGTLLPPYTRFLLWMVDQGEDFFNDDGPSHRARTRLTQQKVVASTLTGEMRMEEFVPESGDNAAKAIETAAKAAVTAAAAAAASGTSNAIGKQRSSMGSLWPLVSNELGLTYDQEEKMKSTFISLGSSENRGGREKIYSVLEFLSKLGEASLQRSPAIHTLTSRFHQILTPVQSARFFIWVEKNRTRIHDCGLDHLLASATCASGSSKQETAKSVASQFVDRSPQDLNVREMTSLLTRIAATA